MSQLKSVIDRYFGRDAFDWFDRAYISDWIFVGILWFLTGAVKVSPVFEREFNLANPTISHPQNDDQVSSFFNNTTALFAPLVVATVIGMAQRSFLIIHHGAIGIFATRGLAELATEVLKHSVGRLRPDFLSRCQWDQTIKACTGEASVISNGRKSFPSGHSSTAFSGMFFISLLIAGQTAAWCFSIPKPSRSFQSSRMGVFLLTLLPLFWATHVAVSRMQDYRHHVEDVVVGSLLGVICSLVCYLIFWPSPFSTSSFRHEVYGQPRYLYGEENHAGPRAREFDLEGDTDH